MHVKSAYKIFRSAKNGIIQLANIPLSAKNEHNKKLAIFCLKKLSQGQLKGQGHQSLPFRRMVIQIKPLNYVHVS